MRSVFVLLLAALAAVQVASAQGLEVSPVRLDFELEPNSTESRTITVRNTSNKPGTYTITSADWSLSEDGQVVAMEAGENERSCAEWLTFTPSLVELDANESQEVTVTINVPNNEVETKWAITYLNIRQEQQAPTADKDLAMGIQFNQSVGVFITQSPRSNKNASAKLKDFKEVTETGDAERTFSVKTENTGDKILDCNMYLVISDLQNATERKLEPISFRVLPEGTIRQELALPSDLKKGSYLVAAILDYGPNYPLEGVQTQLQVD